MGFLDDSPKSVRAMVCVMRDLGHYKYDVGDVFRDFVDYATACFLYNGDKILAQQLKDKYKDHYPKLGELLKAWIGIMNERITDDVQWFDALGTLYEYLASRSKKSWLGQFFTPEHIADLMTMMMAPGGRIGQKVNDCACGSGRMLLSFNSANPGNMLYGEDLDPICAKMTALNMAIHGCQGQATCMDSLNQNWKFCYEVNPYHRMGMPPIPHLVPVSIENCYSKLKPRLAADPIQVIVPEKARKPVFANSGQLTLF